MFWAHMLIIAEGLYLGNILSLCPKSKTGETDVQERKTPPTLSWRKPVNPCERAVCQLLIESYYFKDALGKLISIMHYTFIQRVSDWKL